MQAAIYGIPAMAPRIQDDGPQDKRANLGASSFEFEDDRHSHYGDVMRPEPVTVEVCVIFLKLGEIDTLKEQFSADVLVKAKWREPELDRKGKNKDELIDEDEIDFEKYWNPKLFVENTVGDPKEVRWRTLAFSSEGDAFICENQRLKGTFVENLELNDFPFDVQDLTVTVTSERPASELNLIEDRMELHRVYKQSFIDEQEWSLYKHLESESKFLAEPHGDPSVKRVLLSVKCRAARRPWFFVWNIFLVTFLFCSLSFATFSVEYNLPQNRLQLSFTLVLTAVAFKFVINQSLPRVSYLTYLDKYLLGSMCQLAIVCAWHSIVAKIDSKHDAKVAELVFLTALAVIYIGFNAGICFHIYAFACKRRRIMKQKDREYMVKNFLRNMHRRVLPATNYQSSTLQAPPAGGTPSTPQISPQTPTTGHRQAGPSILHSCSTAPVLLTTETTTTDSDKIKKKGESTVAAPGGPCQNNCVENTVSDKTPPEKPERSKPVIFT
ncbi:uncharacterized protein LOC106156405 isoform X2 [Lingula anatina]|uniref:Uncharacterized protein LOC106156405 isoform X2 n=1 Tax=Lingula anatina TaxID=7574 RepID=A0A1S3HLY6_LINAN|nr:uncharacterized protein LOC106156405 isoform X2 [Lingula anatina]|eukprot:XP_013387103.1 uncharacterized protein LOC106156405 isoform X2 [Lingula anatina]